MIDLEDFLERFEDVRRIPSGGWMAQCPAHEDRNPSLKIDEGDRGPVVHCHAGCSDTDVLRAVGLRWQDIRELEASSTDHVRAEKPREVAAYLYRGSDGNPLYRVIRYEPKGFKQQTHKDGEWVWGLGKDIERVPYRLPELLALQPGATVFITEGEKCADAVAAKGGNVTTNSGGAGSWNPEWGRYFQGLHVIIVADKDEPGRRHAQAVKESVAPFAASVKVVQAKVGKDAFDHLAAGYGSRDFVPVDPSSRYRALDLDLTIPPAAWLLDDLVCMGDVTLLYGHPKAGKTWVSMGLAIAVSHGLPFFLGRNVGQHGRVLYVDEEMPVDLVYQRLHKLGLKTDRWKENLRYLHRQKIRLDEDPGAIIEEAKEFDPTLIVIDNLTRMHRGEENSLEGIGKVLSDGVVPLARETGAAVLLLHHANAAGERPRGHTDITGAVDSIVKLEKDDSSPGRFVVFNSDARRVAGAGKITVDILDRNDGTVDLYAHPIVHEWRAA